MNNKIINIKEYLEKSKKNKEKIYISNHISENTFENENILEPFTGVDIDTHPDGHKYVGEFKNGLKHGKGTYTHPDGQKYIGEWKDDMMHKGTWTHPDGTKYVGEFKDGKAHGQGTWTEPDGTKYVGEFKDGLKHGKGTYTHPNGDVVKVLYEYDELIG